MFVLCELPTVSSVLFYLGCTQKTDQRVIDVTLFMHNVMCTTQGVPVGAARHYMGREFYGPPVQRGSVPGASVQTNDEGLIEQRKRIISSAFFLGGGAIAAEELEYTGDSGRK